MDNILNEIQKFSAEEIINGFTEEEVALEPKTGDEINYRDYSSFTDRDLIYRFNLSMSEEEKEKINKKLNAFAMDYEGENEVCPTCGKHLNLIDNDGCFCKFCGQKLKKNANITFGEGLKAKREEKNMKQKDLAKALNISSSTLCTIEQGKKFPIDIIINASYALDCSVNEFFGQAPSRIKPKDTSIEGRTSNQDFKRGTLEPKETIKVEDFEGYENEYIYRCPTCEKEVDLNVGEALTLGLSHYETLKARTQGNDGYFCKHCGQALVRPVIEDPKKVFNNYKFWINKAK